MKTKTSKPRKWTRSVKTIVVKAPDGSLLKLRLDTYTPPAKKE
jgi:hypothetical protein